MKIKGKNEDMFLLCAPQISRYSNPQFPFKLEQEETKTMFFKYEDFKNVIKKQYSNGWKPKHKKLRIYVNDSSGDVYCGKFKIKMSGLAK